jgi:molecular chaperone IbpA
MKEKTMLKIESYPQFIGFDEFFSDLQNIGRQIKEKASSFPPFNVVKTKENQYAIEVALAGFSIDDIEVEYKRGEVIIASKEKDTSQFQRREFIHRGIGERSFKRQFKLADSIEVIGAHMDNGILTIDLVNVVPEEQRAKKISITQRNLIENKA